MTEEQKAEIVKLKGDPEFKELISEMIDISGLKSALEKEREARKQAEKEANAQKKEAEKAKEKALAEQGDYRKLYEEVQKKYEEVKGKYDSLQSEFETTKTGLGEYEKKYQEIVEARKNEILERIPEDKREKYKDFDITVLETIAKDIVDIKITSPGAEGVQTSGITEETNWDTLTPEQQNKLYIENKPLAQKLIDKAVKNNKYLRR